MERLIFVYGSLLDSRQRDFILKRKVSGDSDVLMNYMKMPHPVFKIYPTIKPKEGKKVLGETFKVSDKDITRLDTYETSYYKKIEVTLSSGKKALAYIDVV